MTNWQHGDIGYMIPPDLALLGSIRHFLEIRDQ